MSQPQQTDQAPDLTYSVAPDLEILELGTEEWLCHSAISSSRIAGPSARLLIEQIIPLLKNGCPWPALVAQLPTVEPTELLRTLDELVAGGILRCHAGAPPSIEPSLAPLLALVDALNLPSDVALARLADARVAIVGLEGVGAQVALLLARCGPRHFTLVDPYPCEPGNLPFLPVGGPGALGRPRQELVGEAMRAANPAPWELDLTLGPPALSPEGVARVVAGCDCVVSCFDRSLAAIHHRVNRASLSAGVPALYAEAAGHQGWAGPLVLPQQTACYMCYRMRAVARAADSDAALAYEEYVDRQTLPRFHDRPGLPTLVSQLAGLLATTVLQVVLDLGQPVLAGRVLEYQALTLATALHPVLHQPDCPDCRAGGPPGPAHPKPVTYPRP